MDYKPYTIEWSRKRALQDAIFDYLEDLNTDPSQICEDIKDILEEWINQYSSRALKGQELRDYFK